VCTTSIDENTVARSIDFGPTNVRKEGASNFPPFSHSWYLKQDDLGKMMQFLSIRGRRLHLLLSRKLERKANPSLPTLMPELETKPKRRR
jgi:hypothetical protein